MARVSVKAYFTYIHASAALAANRHMLISLQLAGAGMHYTECSLISNYLLTFINVHLWSA